MRWLRVSVTFFSLVFLFSVFVGSFVRPVAAVEVFTLSDPALDPADQIAVESTGSEIDVSTSDPVSDSGAVVLAAGAEESDLSGLAFLDISCNLGKLRLYLPYGTDLSAVTVSDSRIYNLTASTLYLYCPDYPGYTFQASRFNTLQYRTGSSSSYMEITGVTLTSSGQSSGTVMDHIYLFVFIVIAFCLIRGCFK